MKTVITMLDSGCFATSNEQIRKAEAHYQIKGDCRGCDQKVPIGELDNAARLCNACALARMAVRS